MLDVIFLIPLIIIAFLIIFNVISLNIYYPILSPTIIVLVFLSGGFFLDNVFDKNIKKHKLLRIFMTLLIFGAYIYISSYFRIFGLV